MTRWILLLAALGVCLPEGLSGQRNPIDGAVQGRVMDETTGTPVVGATVDVLDGVGRIRARAVADENGGFLLTRLDPGAFFLRVRSLGYAELTTPRWWVESGEVLTVVIRLNPDALLLAPLEVIARSRSPSPVLSGFYERLDRRVAGVFLTREQIAARAPSRITDLLAEVPGLRFRSSSAEGDPRRDLVLTFGRVVPGIGGGECPAQVYVDGVLATRGAQPVPIDALASPHLLEGIEIYRGVGTVPAEFLTPEARCGVVALWTRRGG
jgi:hypothetical protein